MTQVCALEFHVDIVVGSTLEPMSMIWSAHRFGSGYMRYMRSAPSLVVWIVSLYVHCSSSAVLLDMWLT